MRRPDPCGIVGWGSRRERGLAWGWFLSLALGAVAVWAAPGRGGPGTVSLSEEEWKKLDTFEESRLKKADQTFAKGQYRQALTEYEAFSQEFTKSRALPYVLFQKARCLQLDNKRFNAIKAYEEVLDYFPNVIDMAASALYFTGECHQQNGELEKAMKTWIELATDKDYRTYHLAANAVCLLADNLTAQGKPAEGVKYYDQVAVDFRQSNPGPAEHARRQTIAYYVRISPHEPKLRDFYKRVGGFERDMRRFTPDAEIALDKLYWQRVWESVWGESRAFNAEQASLRKNMFKYWAGVFDGKFADWEDFQIHAANIKREGTGDIPEWYKRMDELFAAKWKEGDVDRVLRWLLEFRGHKTKIAEYCAKLNYKKIKIPDIGRVVGTVAGPLDEKALAKRIFGEIYQTIVVDDLNNKELEILAFVVFESLGDTPMGQSLIAKMRFGGMPDDEKTRIERRLWKWDAGSVKLICLQFADKDLGKNELLEFYYGLGKGGGKGPAAATIDMAALKKDRIDLASELTGVDRFAKNAWWKKAEFHFWDGDFNLALESYRAADNPPENLWKIVDCYKGLRNCEQAISELSQIENFFVALAPRAALAIAGTYGHFGRTKEQISSLRGVMKKYPKSGESTSAHQQLEKMGVKIGGGTDAE